MLPLVSTSDLPMNVDSILSCFVADAAVPGKLGSQISLNERCVSGGVGVGGLAHLAR